MSASNETSRKSRVNTVLAVILGLSAIAALGFLFWQVDRLDREFGQIARDRAHYEAVRDSALAQRDALQLEITGLEQARDTARAEQDEAQRLLTAAQQARDTALSRQQEAADSFARLDDQLRASRATIDNANDLRAELRTLESQRQSLLSEVARAGSSRDDLQREITQREGDRDRLTDAVQALERRRDGLNTQVQALEDAFSQRDAARRARDQLDQDLQAQRDDLNALIAKRDDLNALIANGNVTLAGQGAQLAGLQSQIGDLQGQRAQATADLARLREDIDTATARREALAVANQAADNEALDADRRRQQAQDAFDDLTARHTNPDSG